MATSRGVYTTGAADEGQDLRRRNVPGYEGSNGDVAQSFDELYDKKASKVGCSLVVNENDGADGWIKQPRVSILQTLDEYEYLLAPLVFTLISFFTRMYKIGLSPIVTWDEAQ